MYSDGKHTKTNQLWRGAVCSSVSDCFADGHHPIFGGDPHIPILVTTAIASIVAIRAGYKWKDIEDGIIDGIKMSMQAILILMIVGMLIGVWILSGVVPTMIYYGLKLLSRGYSLSRHALFAASFHWPPEVPGQRRGQ